MISRLDPKKELQPFEISAFSPDNIIIMWHLAIETSGLEASFALLRDDQIVRQVDLSREQRTTASFAPALKSLVDDVSADANRIGLVSVSVGPGSFTGLRIGVTMAKALCFAWQCDLVAVDTLAIVCHQQRARIHLPDGPKPHQSHIAVCTNAYRGQVFMRIESMQRTDVPPKMESQIVDRRVWEEHTVAPHIFAWGYGPSKTEQTKDLFASEYLPPVNPSMRHRTHDDWPRPTADALGELAWNLYRSGRRDDYWSLMPNYLRPSAAEEKIDAKT